MNNKVKTVLIIVVVIAVLLLAAFAPGKKFYEKISYEEYQKLDKPSLVYVSDDDAALDNFKDMDINKDYSIYYLDYSKLDDNARKDVKNGVLELWKDKKFVGYYDFNRFVLKDGEKAPKLNTVDIDEYLKLKDSKGFNFMFIGRETCGYCTKFKEAIDALHKEYNVNINYIDTDSLDEQGMQQLLSTEEYLQNEQWGTPTSFVYYNGNQLDMISGYIDENALKEKLNTYGIKMFLMDNEVL